MRKKLLLLGLGAMLFSMSPVVYAATYNGTTSTAGAAVNETQVDMTGTPGETGYGYYTGTDPFADGTGHMDITDHALSAPSYTHPCPESMTCSSALDLNGDVTDPQTDPGNASGFSGGLDDVNVWNIPIIDDLMAKMSDEADATHYVRQTMDILFVLAPNAGGTGKGLIDQTLDQDLASYTGDLSSCVWGDGGAECPVVGGYDGVGITQRLISRTAIEDNTLSKLLPGSIGTGVATYNEQLLVTAVKDVTGGNGIFQSYTSYFGADNNVTPSCGAACSSAIAIGHDPVAHTLPSELDNHP